MSAKHASGDDYLDYYLRRDAFLGYVTDFVNPARAANHLPPLDLCTAKEVFRLIDEQPWKGGQAGRE